MKKTCPQCGKTAKNEKEVCEKFGFRVKGCKKYAQSWCKTCEKARVRAKKQTSNTKTLLRIYDNYSNLRQDKVYLINRCARLTLLCKFLLTLYLIASGFIIILLILFW